MVANSRAKMSKVVSGVSKMVVKECQTSMLINDMDISRLMFHAQQIEEEKLLEKSREVKRAKTSDGNFSHPRSDGQGRPRFRQRFFGQDSSNAPLKFKKYRVSNSKPQGAKRREGKQVTTSGAGSNTPKQNRFYTLQTRGEQEGFPDVVTGMLKVFQLDVYALLDPGDTLSLVTPYVAMRFYVLPDVLLEPFSVSTPIGNSIVAKRVYRKCLVSLSNRVTLVDLVELDMLDFDII
uniref:Gag-pol polyprotein n=1 Tax=Solanum tuberosum TaxID=4113 RepID=M0ZKD2_SOLTU